MWEFKNKSKRNIIFCFLLLISVIFFSNFICPYKVFAEDGSLISHHQFHNNLQDSVDKHHGTFSGGSPVYVDGISGKALKLDGADDYVGVPDAPDLNLSAAITISTWIKVDRFIQYAPLVKKAGRGNASGGGYALEMGGNHEVFFWLCLDPLGWRSSGPTPAIQQGQWYNLVGTYDGQHIRIYLNGNLVSSQPAQGTISASSNNLNIGRDPSNPNRLYSGVIDEVKIYSRALSSQEIKDEYDSVISPEPSPPSSPSPIPQLMRFQARLTDTGGEPVSGEHSITFSLYDRQTEGEPLWSETQEGVVVDSGILDAVLGSVKPIDLPFDKQYWLGIRIDDDEEMSPRIMLTTVPYSFRAKE